METLDEILRRNKMTLAPAPQRVPGTSLSVLGGGATPPPPAAPARPTAPTPTGGRSRLAQMEPIKPQQPEPGKPWWKQIKGFTIGAVKNVGKAGLTALQVPGRLVVAGVENQAENFLGRDIGPKNSETSLGDRVFGSDYGFGSLIGDLTGNKWVNRALGFAGDVALDPLTYLTFGSTSAAGAGARLGMQTRAAALGLGDDVIARAGKGAAFLDDAERAALGIERAGVYFAGGRIPGSGGVARAVGKTTARVRHRITGSRPWQVIARHPDPTREADVFNRVSKILRTGRPEPNMSVGQAAALMRLREVQLQAGRSFQGPIAEAINNLGLNRMGEAERIAMTHAAEAGDVPAIRQILDQARKALEAADVHMNFIEDGYVPHMLRREAIQFLDGSTAARVDLSKGTGSALARKWTAENGIEVTHRGATYKLRPAGTLLEKEAELQRVFGNLPGAPAKFFEDDPMRWLPRYVGIMSENVGRRRMVDEAINLGLMRASETNEALRDVIRENLDLFEDDVLEELAQASGQREFTRQVNELLRERREELKVAVRKAREAVPVVQQRVVDELEPRLAQLGSIGDDLATVAAQAKARGLDAQAQGRAVERALRTAQRTLERRTKKAEAEFFRLERQIDSLKIALANARDEAQVEVVARLAAMEARATQLRGVLDEGTQIAQQLTLADNILREISEDFYRVVDMADDPWAFDEFIRRTFPEVQAPVDEVAAQLDEVVAAQTRAAEKVDVLDAVKRVLPERYASEMEAIDQAKKIARFNADAAAGAKAAVDAEVRTLKSKLRAVKGEADRMSARRLIKLHDQLANDPELARALPLVRAEMETLADVGFREMQLSQLKQFRDMINSPGFSSVFKRELERGWVALEDNIAGLPLEAQYEVAEALHNLVRAVDEHKLVEYFDAVTSFFRRYATASPGFHIRNAIGATFMNITEGVTVQDHLDAFRWFRQFEQDPFAFMAKATDEQRAAFDAVFRTGTSGIFSPEELGEQFTGRVAQRVMDNFWLRWNKEVGGKVEGGVRLALALRSIRDGQDVATAAARVARIHFDYTDLSQLDRWMRRAIPFWTFMSRNLPLQFTQMAMRPRLYVAYEKAISNFGEDADWLPQWIDRDKAPMVGDWGIVPDLQHLNLQNDIESIDVSDPLRVLSNLNPTVVSPLEALSGRSFLYGSEMEPEDRWMHVFRQMVPPWRQVESLGLGPAIGLDRYEGQQIEKLLRFMGAPVLKRTEERVEAAERRRARGG